MKNQESYSKFILALGMVCLLLGGGLAIWLGISYWRATQTAQEAGRAFTQAQTEAVVDYLDAEMRAQQAMTKWVADQLSVDSLEPAAVEQLLQAGIARKPNLFGLAIAYVPNLVPGQRLFAPFYQLTDSGERKTVRVDSKYDYTDPGIPTTVWYSKTAEIQKPGWYHYFGKAANDWLIVYAVPFYRDGKFAGVAASVHSVNSTFRQFWQHVPIGKEGYLALLDEHGIFVEHPKSEYNERSLLEVAYELKDHVLIEAAGRLSSEEQFIVERPSTGGFNSWTSFATLPTSNWKVVVVIRQDVKALTDQEKIRQLVQIGLLALLAINGAALLFFKPRAGNPVSLWGFSVSLGMSFLFGIIWIWALIYLNPLENGSGTALTNDQDLAAALVEVENAEVEASRGLPQRIPTGVVIETISVTNRSSALSGYLWQKYPLQIPAETIEPPKFTNEIKATNWKQTHNFVRNGVRVIGWSFVADLSEKFEVERYPLDEITVKLKVEPANLAQNVVLVPDLESYDFISPSNLPGLVGGLELPGWNIRTAYFKYENNQYNSDFGSEVNVLKNENPLLAYHIHATRDLFSPLIAYTIVIYVILVQIFGIVMLKIEKPQDILSVGAALFLVNAIKHNGLRTELAASGTIYLEYFFILLYVTILVASITSVARTLKLDLKWLQENDNGLTKMLYWPLYLGLSLVITLQIFYPR